MRSRTPVLLVPLAAALAPLAAQGQAAAPAAASASAPAQSLPEGRIRASRPNETEERRQSSAAKIVIGRQEIEQFGDASLGDVLRRLPGVTQGGRPGRGGEIRMRGMGGGYTQILIDGQRTPPGFSIEQLSPDMVERIEVLRAPTAETGTRAIAGTINIVLREPLRRTNNELRAGVSTERGRGSANAAWTRDDRFGEDGLYNLTLSAGRSNERTDTDTRTIFVDEGAPTPVLDWSSHERSVSVRRNVSLSGRVQWRLGAGEQFSLRPFVSARRGDSEGERSLAAAATGLPAPYATRLSSSGTDIGIARLAAELVRRIEPATRIDLNGTIGRFSLDGTETQLDSGGSQSASRTTDFLIRDRSASLTGKLTQDLGDSHNLVGGAEFETVRRNERSDGPLFDEDVQARTQRTALFVQNEWAPAKGWSTMLGLRAEQIHTRSDTPQAQVDNSSRVLSPLAHLVWRFDAPRRDQLRLSLTQSYRAPTLRNLSPVPSLNSDYPESGPNVASSPDRAGNPALKPERAHGIDLAFERYGAGGGVVSVNLFHRRIRDLIRTATALEDVPWSPVPRWVARPRNLGRASTSGIEFDAKGRLDEWRPGWPALNLQANLSVFRSRVDEVPGPDNRIDQQPEATGSLGADYRLPGSGWTVGGSVNVTPGYRTQLTELQSQSLGAKRILDAFVLWQIDPATRLRLSAANLLRQDSESTASVWQGTQLQTVDSIGRTERVFGVRLEMRL